MPTIFSLPLFSTFQTYPFYLLRTKKGEIVFFDCYLRCHFMFVYAYQILVIKIDYNNSPFVVIR